MTTLDAFIAEQGIKRVDALKLDVEGTELYVIRSAHATTQQHKPFMMVEINFPALKAANTSSDELFNTIVSYGYNIFIIRNGKAIFCFKSLRKMSIHRYLLHPAPERMESALSGGHRRYGHRFRRFTFRCPVRPSSHPTQKVEGKG